MSYKKFVVILVIVWALAVTVLWKHHHVYTVTSGMKWTANYLVWEQKEEGMKTEFNDNKIIAAKIFPKTTFQYTINPFVMLKK